MENSIIELTLEEQKEIYGGTRVIVGYQQLENGDWVPIYDDI